MMTVSSSFSSPFYACATMRWAWRPGQLSAAAFPLSSLCVQNWQKILRYRNEQGNWYPSAPAPTGSLYRQEFAGSTEIALF